MVWNQKSAHNFRAQTKKCAGTWNHICAAHNFARQWIIFCGWSKQICASLNISAQWNKYFRTDINVFLERKTFLRTVQMFFAHKIYFRAKKKIHAHTPKLMEYFPNRTPIRYIRYQQNPTYYDESYTVSFRSISQRCDAWPTWRNFGFVKLLY